MFRRRDYPWPVQAAKTLTISAPLHEIDDYLAHKLTKALTPKRADALDDVPPMAATLDSGEPDALWVDDERAALVAVQN